MSKERYTWVKTHEKITEYLSSKENSQLELIELLKSVGITPFNDKAKSDIETHDIDLNEIDPFTFYCYIYKYGDERRLNFLQKIAKKIGAQIPSDEKGIPSAQAQKVWLFPYKYDRVNNEIPRLWDFFKKALDNKITNLDFSDILKIKGIGKTKITEALFYIKPEKYLPINGPTKPFIELELGINPSFNTYSEYLSLLEAIKTKTNVPFYELSYKAWKWNMDRNNNKTTDEFKYSKQLFSFLEQAKTDSLKTKHFDSEYLGTDVKVSFGQGNAARIPWISFLKSPNTTSDGIYPVYLYYKDYEILILAYGVSETNTPSSNWEIQKVKTINDYFEENYSTKPKRYGTSYIYKVYNVNQLPSTTVIDNDLNKLINFYLGIKVNKQVPKTELLEFDKNNFIDNLERAGLVFDPVLVNRFIASLLTKPFVIFTGLSGSGKTKLAQSFAQWICESKEQYCIVPVGADWINREPLLGYVNALNNKEYVLPENKALELIIKANDDKTKPYFLILDEMNLSHVERYFADFLSVMESNDNFKLHSSKENLNKEKEDDEQKNGSIEVPSELPWPENLFVIGTVNIDETTYMFSPKVLDRANVIEFRIDVKDLNLFFESTIPFNLKKLYEEDGKTGLGAKFSEDFVKKAKSEVEKENLETLNKELEKFFIELQKVGAEFGYRSASEIQTLFRKIDTISPDYSKKSNEKVDIAIMQKLLPKLHGSRSKLVDVLKVLASLCYDSKLTEEDKKEIFDKGSNVNAKIIYPISLEKITRMYHNVVANGFTSYAEA